VLPADAAIVRVDEKALIDQMEAAGKHNADIQVRQANRAKMQKDIDDGRARIKKLEEEISIILGDVTVKEDKLAKAPALAKPIDVAAVRARLDNAKATNAAVELRERKEALEKESISIEQQAAKLTEVMDLRQAKKNEAIAAAKLPVPGMSFGDGALLLNGVPFNQASDAEQLRASVEVAMASNSELRVIRIRQGSLLDDDAMKLLAKIAEERDFQIWIERVDSSGTIGFVIEDGHLKDGPQEATAARVPRPQPKPQPVPPPQTQEYQEDII
jgi:hypothetical protein